MNLKNHAISKPARTERMIPLAGVFLLTDAILLYAIASITMASVTLNTPVNNSKGSPFGVAI